MQFHFVIRDFSFQEPSSGNDFYNLLISVDYVVCTSWCDKITILCGEIVLKSDVNLLVKYETEMLHILEGRNSFSRCFFI